MSILIPGMEMPCEGLMTIIAIGYDGRVFQPIEYPDEHTLYHGTKYNAIELPPHGRLGDLDALLAKLKKDPLFPLVEQYGMSGVIEAQPTVIPAEPEKEETT